MVTLVLSVLNILCFFLVLLMHLPTHPSFVCKIILDTPSYIAYTGAYSQTMVIHAFCNVDDVSWGTKGSSGSGGKKYEVDKVLFVGSW
jgi:chitin synthase